MLRAAAEAGLGICMLPSFIAAPGDRGAARVEVLLRDYPLEEGALHAVMPPGRAATARVRALVDFLVARFGPEPGWDPCWLAPEARRGRWTRGDGERAKKRASVQPEDLRP